MREYCPRPNCAHPCFLMDIAPEDIRTINLRTPLRRAVLAMGADMKNSVAAGYDSRVMLSPQTGDLDTLEAVEGLERAAQAMPSRLGRGTDVVAVDLHPDMRSTRTGRKLAAEWNLPVVEVQHHHAHAAACLAENGRTEGLVLVMDGTGWGGDGTIWGAELLDLRANSFHRCASFSPVPLPGGDAAVRRPARQVVGRWVQAGIQWADGDLALLDVSREEADVWGQQCAKRVNAPSTHASGRVFDAFSVILGLAPRDITCEGEPAILLEAAARSWRGEAVPEIPFRMVEDKGFLWVDWAPAFRYLHEIPSARDDAGRWAMAAHVAIARAATAMIEFALSKVPARSVGLSGGVFMNRILNELLDRHLGSMGMTVLRHRETPPGDGGIALGQVVVAGN